MNEMQCDLIYCWLVMLTVSLADVLRAGNVRTKLRTIDRVRNAAKLPVYLL